MTRARWTREEVEGYALAWLVDITYGGRVLRVATYDVDVTSDDGDLHYFGTCEPMVYQRAIDLFSRQAEEDAIAVECRVPADVPTLAAAGHRLDGSRVQVSQVRVRVGGATIEAVDDYEDRRVLLTGVLRDGEYGPYAQGTAALRFSVQRRLKRTRAQVPATWEAVSAQTWPTTYLRGEDLGIAYPVVFGYPGKDDRSQDGFIPAFQSVYARKQYKFQVLIAGLGVLDASTMRICTEDDPIGQDVTLSTTYRDYEAAATVEALDRHDTRLTVVDYHDQNYYIGGASELISTYQADASTKDATPIYCALTSAGGGGMLYGGKVCRAAGDVIAYLLERAGVPFDLGSASDLDAYLIDAVIAESVSPVDWIREQLLPLLPMSLVDGESGVRVVAWSPGRTATDATFALDCDANPLLWPGERMHETDGQANLYTLKYGWNHLAQRHRYTARIGPRAEESADQAAAVIRSQRGATASYGGVRIQFIAPGSAGVGWTVTCTDTGVEGVTVTTASRLIAVTFDGGSGATTTSSTLATTLNAAAAFSAIATAAVTDDDGTTITWISTSTASVTLQIQDLGTVEHASCRAAYDQRRREDGGDPLEEEVIETDVIYDHDMAARLLDVRARLYAGTQRRQSILGPVADMAGIDLGDTGTYTDSLLGASGLVGTVEAVEERSTGEVAVRMVFLDE